MKTGNPWDELRDVGAANYRMVCFVATIKIGW